MQHLGAAALPNSTQQGLFSNRLTLKNRYDRRIQHSSRDCLAYLVLVSLSIR